jgi:predicted transposase YdaD
MWDEEIRVPVMKDSAEKYRKLEVSCWAKESRKEENIGQGHIDLTETLKTGEFDGRSLCTLPSRPTSQICARLD